MKYRPFKFGFLIGLALLGATLVSCQILPLTSSARPGTAIIYGAGAYVVDQLNGPPNDADDMTSLFGGQGWTTIEKKDSAATLANFSADIQAVTATVQPFDRVLLYFSGHGTTNPLPTLPGQWVVFYDGYDGNFYPSGMMDATKLNTLVGPLLAKQALVIVILDTCYSGSLVPDYDYINNLPYNYAVVNSQFAIPNPNSGMLLSQSIAEYFGNGSPDSQGKPLGAPNLWVISACGPLELSEEDQFTNTATGVQRWNGVFTRFFMESALYGDQNNDHVVSLYEAYRYTKALINAQWNQNTTITNANPNADVEYLPQMSGNPYDTPLFTR
jgi:hypothetical protein